MKAFIIHVRGQDNCLMSTRIEGEEFEIRDHRLFIFGEADDALGCFDQWASIQVEVPKPTSEETSEE